AFFHELPLVHFRGRCDPEPCGDNISVLLEECGRSAEVPNVRHTGANKNFVHLRPSNSTQWLYIIGIIGAGEQRLPDSVHIDLNDRMVLSVVISFEKGWVLDPLLHL